MMEIAKPFKVLAIMFAVAAFVTGLVVGGQNNEIDITTTNYDSKSLQEFKSLVINEIPATSYIQNYINDDLYFTRWLEASSFDVKAAEKMFLNHLEWRKSENIDTIDREDFSEIRKDMPMFFDTLDRKGTPTVEIFGSDFDIRKIISEEKSTLMLRFLTYMTEVLTRKVYESRAKGKNVSQANVLQEVENTGFTKVACLQCFSIYSEFFSIQAQHYPNIFKNWFIVDMLPMVEFIMQILRPFMSSQTRRAFHTFSVKEDWMERLDQIYDKNQRSVRFGGTIVRKF